LFRRISHGAVRLQEVLADRMAAHVYGPAAFEEGLRHVIGRSVEFSAAVSLEMQSALEGKRPVTNLYALPPLPTVLSTDVEQGIANAISRPTTEDDTHPCPSDRFRLVKQVSSNGASRDSRPVWALFADPDRLMAEMTAMVAQQIGDANLVAV
jgi:hypothetical protein